MQHCLFYLANTLSFSESNLMLKSLPYVHKVVQVEFPAGLDQRLGNWYSLPSLLALSIRDFVLGCKECFAFYSSCNWYTPLFFIDAFISVNAKSRIKSSPNTSNTGSVFNARILSAYARIQAKYRFNIKLHTSLFRTVKFVTVDVVNWTLFKITSRCAM